MPRPTNMKTKTRFGVLICNQLSKMGKNQKDLAQESGLSPFYVSEILNGKELYFDNGKDYREKSFNKDFPLSLTKQLGINQIYATPYHGQAKPIERFWETLEDRFCKFFPT